MEASVAARGLTLRGLLKRVRDHLAGRDQGYVLIIGMLVMSVLLLLGGALLLQVQRNQQHVTRDRAYTQSLAIAEAGLNQYLWMVIEGISSEVNDFAIPGAPAANPNKMTFVYTDPHDGSIKGEYTTEVDPPTASRSSIEVKVTGVSHQPVDQSRTVFAHLNRPAFSEYIMITNEVFTIAGAPDDPDRKWWGRTHSNKGVCVETTNINDLITCANSNPGVYTHYVPLGHPSRDYWKEDVGWIDFSALTGDLNKLNEYATDVATKLPYSTATGTGWGKPPAHGDTRGWYIWLKPNQKYQIRLVTGETESKAGQGNKVGGSLSLDTTGLAAFGLGAGEYDYPAEGVIYVNDNVWVEGTNLEGRITIACSGQLNPVGYRDETSLHVVGDITYKEKNGEAAVGLIAEKNVEIPAYAPLGKGGVGSLSDVDMEIDAAMIAQKGARFARAAQMDGPLRDYLIIYGSNTSNGAPFRVSGNHGFANADTQYDPFLLHNPPPHFPTIGTYQIVDWRELPAGMAVEP